MPKNRLIITWKDNSPSRWMVSRESMKCGSLQRAQGIVDKGPSINMSHATVYDSNGKGVEIKHSYPPKVREAE